MTEPERVATSMRFPRATLDALDAEARRRMVSRNWLVERIIEQWLRDESITVDPSRREVEG